MVKKTAITVVLCFLISFYFIPVSLANSTTDTSGGAPLFNLKGFYIGVGTSISNFHTKNNNVTFSNTFPGGNVSTFDNFSSDATSMSPSFDFSYWRDLSQQWQWGVDASYIYFNESATTRVADNDYPSLENIATFSIALHHQLSALFLVGKHADNWLIYMGAGPSWFPGVKAIDNYGDSPSSSEDFWGGTVKLGVLYHLEANWFINSYYSYTVSGDKQIVSRITFDPEHYFYKRDVQLRLQSFGFTINRRF